MKQELVIMPGYTILGGDTNLFSEFPRKPGLKTPSGGVTARVIRRLKKKKKKQAKASKRKPNRDTPI